MVKLPLQWKELPDYHEGYLPKLHQKCNGVEGDIKSNHVETEVAGGSAAVKSCLHARESLGSLRQSLRTAHLWTHSCAGVADAPVLV